MLYTQQDKAIKPTMAGYKINLSSAAVISENAGLPSAPGSRLVNWRGTTYNKNGIVLTAKILYTAVIRALFLDSSNADLNIK